MKNPVDKFETPTGVEVRGQTVRITFMLGGIRRREIVSKIVDKKSIKYAEKKRTVVLLEIEEKRFDYEMHFPESPYLAKLKMKSSEITDKNISEALDDYLENAKREHATSTYEGYKGKATHIRKQWPKTLFSQISKQDIKDFQHQLLEQGLQSKTVNDVFTIVRALWHEAAEHKIIPINPLISIRNIVIDDEEKEPPNPYKKDEMAKIIKQFSRHPQIVAMHQFTCWTGLSVSEAIGIAWEDLSSDEKSIKVKRAYVCSEYKVPKEKSRTRKIDLLPEAINWLNEQKKFTLANRSIKVQVRLRNNRTFREDIITPIFENPDPQSIGPWTASSLNRAYTNLLKKAGVSHRGANHCRHTYASRLLSAFVPLEVIAHTMGHVNTSMIRKNYGKWIEEETPDTAKIISELLNRKL
jgi:integrase